MPSSWKTPAAARKKVTALARARSFTGKVRKQASKDLNESYIQPEPDIAVSSDYQLPNNKVLKVILDCMN